MSRAHGEHDALLRADHWQAAAQYWQRYIEAAPAEDRCQERARHGSRSNRWGSDRREGGHRRLGNAHDWGERGACG